VYELMGEALCLVLTSQCYEQFPRVVAEAFAKGTPILASDLGAMARLVDPGRTGLLFPPGDAACLAAAAEYLLDDPATRDTLRQGARAEFEANYTAESNYRALMEIYEAALRRSQTLTHAIQEV
jgi:glycosyltransferase involved in cell wall biosynthesis